MVFRRKVVREIPEALQDGQELADVLRARRVLEGFGALWRELYHRLLLDVYMDSNIPAEDKVFVVETIATGISRALERGGLLPLRRAIDTALSELLKDMAAVLEGKKRVILEKQAEELALSNDVGEESFTQLFTALKTIGLEMYKEIRADSNIKDKRETWRIGFLTFVDLATSYGAPALEMLLTKYGHVLAKAFRVALEAGEA